MNKNKSLIPCKKKTNCFSKTINSLFEVECFLNNVTKITKISKLFKILKN